MLKSTRGVPRSTGWGWVAVGLQAQAPACPPAGPAALPHLKVAAPAAAAPLPAGPLPAGWRQAKRQWWQHQELAAAVAAEVARQLSHQLAVVMANQEAAPFVVSVWQAAGQVACSQPGAVFHSGFPQLARAAS